MDRLNELDRPSDLLIAMIAISHHVLVEDALQSEEGRAQVKEIFRAALAAVPAVQSTIEWKIAMQHIEEANAAESAERGDFDPVQHGAIRVHESEVTPISAQEEV